MINLERFLMSVRCDWGMLSIIIILLEAVGPLSIRTFNHDDHNTCPDTEGGLRGEDAATPH